MKSNVPQIGLVQLLFICTIFSQQANPDLILQSEVTPEYIVYLTGREATWLVQAAVGGDDAETMKAHMGLAILSFAWSHVDGDTFLTDLEPILDDISQNADSIGNRVVTDLLPIFLDASSQDEFFNMLIDFFESGDYVDFRDSVTTYLDNMGEGFDEAGTTLDHLFENLDENFSDEHYRAHLDAILEGTADFEFSIQVMGSEYQDDFFVFSRTFFSRTETLEDLGMEIDTKFENGADWIDSVMAYSDGDVMPGVAYFREGLDKMVAYLDTLHVILMSDPFTPFAIDVSPLDSLQEAVLEVDTLLGGKIYAIGPESEGKTIKPLAIIQNLPGDGLWHQLEGFYSSNDSANYTFGGIFPEGLPSDALDFISADAIINDFDDEDAFYAHLLELKAGWQQEISIDPSDPDAHMGVALVLMYEMVRDNEETFVDIFRLLDEGRIDSLTYYYDWDDVDLSDEISEIGSHVDSYVDADELKHFNFLIKTEPDSYGPYTIGPESQFDIVHVSIFETRMARDLLSLAGDALSLMATGLVAVFDEISEIFIVDLDPSVLDFSQVDSDTALILMLETSNPDFLSVTPYGVEQFHKTGDQLEEAFEGLGNFFDQMTDLAIAMAPYDEDFGMDGDLFIEAMESASDVSWEFWTDFAFPDSTTIVNGEQVNFSAWFDNPPPSFLIMWKDYVFGNDSTLGGLFPDRPVAIESYMPGILPKEFILYPNYPNPFNPITHVALDIPKGGEISLVIYNLQGEEVTRLVDEHVSPGRKIINWDAAGLSSGIYICRLEYGGKFLSKKMMLIK